MAVMKQARPDSGAMSDVPGCGLAPGDSYAPHPDVYALSLQTVAAGILNGVSPMQFMNRINVVNQALGNRAFLQWVGALGAARRAGSAADLPDAALPLPYSSPLQLMGKKKKKQPADVEAGSGKQAAGAPEGAGTEATGTVVPGPEAARLQATGTLPGVEPEPVEDAAGEAKKKKKKSRVQVALNALRGEGVAAFGGYIEAEIGEAELLRTLVQRINRAEDLAGVREEALGTVEARLRLLDSEGVGGKAAAETQGLPRAEAMRQEPEIAEIAPIKSELKLSEKILFACCSNGDVGRLKRLLNQNRADVNMANVHGPLLCYATANNQKAVVRELLSRPGINVNLPGKGAATPLYLAIQQGHVGVMKLLLAASGINVNLASITGAPPLIVAAQKGNLEVVGLLLNMPNIRVNARKFNGATALFHAAQENHPDIVDLLIKHGADVNLTFDRGDTSPLGIACKFGHIEVVKRLLKAPGAQINQTTDKGATALGIAAKNGQDDIVRLLLENGADPNIGGKSGITPIDAACLSGHANIVRMLLDSGACTDAERTLPGATYTTSTIAELGGHREVMSVLTAHRQRRERGQTRAEGRTVPSPAPPDTVAGQPAQQCSLTSLKQPDSRPNRDMKPAEDQAAGDQEKTGEATAHASAIPPAPAAPGEGKELSPLAQAKDALRQEVLGKLRADNFDTLQGIRLLEDINATDSIDTLCGLYNRLAHIERREERARRQGRRQEVLHLAPGPVPAAADPAAAPAFVLAGKTGLDAEGVEVEIKQHLGRKYHRFVSQAVNDMEFGRGKPTSGYRGLWHVSAGIPGVGSCSVFYYLEGSREKIRVVGIGRHAGRAAYQLDYAAEELGEAGRILRIA